MKKEPFDVWSFKAPEYDHRTGPYMNAGDHHGVGYTQPVGHKGDPKQFVPCLPYKDQRHHEKDD